MHTIVFLVYGRQGGGEGEGEGGGGGGAEAEEEEEEEEARCCHLSERIYLEPFRGTRQHVAIYWILFFYLLDSRIMRFVAIGNDTASDARGEN